MNFIISGHEDNKINFFDSNSGIIISSSYDIKFDTL